MNVNEENAINYSAVYACVRVIAETVASLPLHVYRRLPNGGKQRAPDHPLYDILHDMPNPEMTSFTLREVMQGHLLLWGNAYALIEWDRSNGTVRSIWPIPPNRVNVERDLVTNEIKYRVILPDNSQRILQEYQMLHIPGFGFDGLKGLSPIGLARQAIGLGLAAEEFGARFFGSGTHLGGIIKHPDKLSDQAHRHLKESINEAYAGLGRSHRIMLLEEGMDFVKIGIPPEDAQFLETRKFQVNEIARIFRVPPHMIGDLERATFSNIEHQSIEFVVHTIRPWLVRWEQTIKWKLFLPSERRSFFAEFVVDGLLRGDIKSRYEAYAIGRQNGWLSADDIRELENMNPLPDGQGKIYLIPANMMPANQVGSGPTGQQEVTDKEAGQQEDRSNKAAWEERSMRSARLRRQLAIIQKPLFRDAAARVVRREVNDVRKAAKEFLTRRNLSDFNQWLIEYYEQYPSFVEENMLPIFLSYAELVQAVAAQEIGLLTGMTEQMVGFVRAYVTNFINRYVGSSLNQLQAIAREAQAAGEDPLPLIEQRLDEWEEKRPDKVANREVIQAGNAIALATYTSGGVLYKRWNAIGKDCPYCRRLDGMVIGIDQTFVNVGQDFQPEGAEKPLRPETSIGHPPLHRGCDCMITSAM